MNKKGFTLIELLVVIAIIGILSSIAIVYLNDARQKANDAKVTSNVTTISTQVEVDRAGNTAISDTSIATMIARLGQHPCGTGIAADDWAVSHTADFSKVAVYAKLCSAGNTTFYYCADSDTYRGTTTVAIADEGTCNVLEPAL